MGKKKDPKGLSENKMCLTVFWEVRNRFSNFNIFVLPFALPPSFPPSLLPSLPLFSQTVSDPQEVKFGQQSVTAVLPQTTAILTQVKDIDLFLIIYSLLLATPTGHAHSDLSLAVRPHQTRLAISFLRVT